jgi:TolA-binding protein
MLSQDSIAKRQFNLYIEQYPKGRFAARSLFYLAKINRNQKEYQKAIDQYDEIIKKYYYTEIADKSGTEIANTYYEKGDFKSSYRIFSQNLKALQSNPFENENNQDEYIYKIALSYEKLNDLDNAKKYYQIYILRYKNGTFFNDAIFNLGTIYEKEGKKDLAVAFFKQINNSSGDIKVSLRIADLFYNHDQYKEALAKYLNIIDSSKDEIIVKNCKAKVIVINYKIDNLVEALRLQKIFEDSYNKIDQYLAEFEYERASYYYRIKNYDLAKKIFLDVVDEYEKTEFAAWSMYWVGKLEESSSQNEEAIKVFDWVIKNFPISKAAARSNLSLGNIYFRNEKFDLALKYYKTISDKPLEESQIYSSALNNLIECYNKLSLYDAAIEYCRKFIELYPGDESITEKKLKIGIFYKQLKYYDQAIVHFQSLLDYVDQNIEAEIRYYIGECYYSKNDHQQALLEFLKITYLITKHEKIDWVPPAYYMAGQCYEKMNKFEQAIIMYQQIIDKPGIDSTFKAQAIKEIERVRTLLISNKK